MNVELHIVGLANKISQLGHIHENDIRFGRKTAN